MMQNSNVPIILRKHLNLDVEDAKVRFANNVQKTPPLVYWKHSRQVDRQFGKLFEDCLCCWKLSASLVVVNHE
eukprot:1512369-Rhodomonas_salina.1